MALTLVGAAGLASCKAPLHREVKPAEFRNYEEAGTGHVAVLSVGEWDRYVDDMKTAFAITPEQAIAQAGATTALMENKLLDTLKVIVKAATPSTALDITKREVSGPVDKDGNTLGADGKPIAPGSYRDAVETEKAGTLPADPASLATGKAAKDLPGLGESGLKRPDQLGSAALTQYQLATALTQEVHLLNRYVSDAAVRKGYEASVVRVQVSLMPKVRNGPYDAYTTLSFFPSDATLEALRCATPRGGNSRSLPVVVPLLVTDDMEAALAANSSDTIRQYALALSAMVRGFSASADVERYTDELVSTVTRDYNSLYSVARLTDNTVRVRMGARLTSTRQYFMVPQTHNVTLLVLTPKSWPNASDVVVQARTDFTDVRTGVDLSGRSNSRHDEIFADLITTYFQMPWTSAGRAADIAVLKHASEISDYPTFRERVFAMRDAKRRAHAPVDEPDEVVFSGDSQASRALWTAFTQVATGAQYASTLFTLPERCPCFLPQSNVDGVATAADDGGGSFVVELRPVRNINPLRLGVRLRLAVPKCKDQPNGAAQSYYVAASDVKFDRDREVLRCGFPGLSRVKIGGKLAAPGVSDGSTRAWLEVGFPGSACANCKPGCPTEYFVNVATVLKAPPTEAKAATVTTPKALRVCTKCGPGEIDVVLERSEPDEGAPAAESRPVVLSFAFTDAAGKATASGVIVSAKLDGKPLPADAVDRALNEVSFPLAAKARLTLVFDQLADASKLTIVLRSKKPEAELGNAEVAIFVSDDKAACCGKDQTPPHPTPAPADPGMN